MYERERKIDGIRTAPLVSVIMPAYNAEKYIEEAVSSVLSQTYKNWELLILDDCSSDCTAEIAEYFASLDTRIRLLRNPQNMGVAKTRNRGFDIAKGEWIALLDSDDVWHSDKLEKQLAVAGRAGADIIYCSYALVNESGAHAFRRGLRAYTSSFCLGTCAKDASTCFRGFDEKYFYDQGVLYRAVFGAAAAPLCLRFCLKRHNTYRGEMTFSRALRAMRRGTRETPREKLP